MIELGNLINQLAILLTIIKQEQVYCQNMTQNNITHTKLAINQRRIDQQLQLFENYKIIPSLPNVQENSEKYPDDIGQEGRLLPVHSSQSSPHKRKIINLAEFSHNYYADNHRSSSGYVMMKQYEQFHNTLLAKNKCSYRKLSSNIKTKAKSRHKKVEGIQTKEKPKKIKIKLFKKEKYQQNHTHTLQSEPATKIVTHTLESEPVTKSVNIVMRTLQSQNSQKKSKFRGLSLSQSPLFSPCRKIKLYSCKKKGRNALQVLPSTSNFHQKGDSIMVRLRSPKKKNTDSPKKGIFLFSKEKQKQKKQPQTISAFPICSPIRLKNTNLSMFTPNSSKGKLSKLYSRNIKF